MNRFEVPRRQSDIWLTEIHESGLNDVLSIISKAVVKILRVMKRYCLFCPEHKVKFIFHKNSTTGLMLLIYESLPETFSEGYIKGYYIRVDRGWHSRLKPCGTRIKKSTST